MEILSDSTLFQSSLKQPELPVHKQFISVRLSANVGENSSTGTDSDIVSSSCWSGDWEWKKAKKTAKSSLEKATQKYKTEKKRAEKVMQHSINKTNV